MYIVVLPMSHVYRRVMCIIHQCYLAAVIFCPVKCKCEDIMDEDSLAPMPVTKVPMALCKVVEYRLVVGSSVYLIDHNTSYGAGCT